MSSAPAAAEAAASDAASDGVHLQVRGVSKHFGAVTALSGVDLSLRRGEVTGLVGDNGAGKSTLMKIVAGVYEQDEGELLIDGRRLELRAPSDAVHAGIQTVFQDLAICENLDVSSNLFLGYEETVGWASFLPQVLRPLDLLEMEEQSRRALDKLNIRTLTSVQSKVGSLSGGQRQAVAIARAVRAESTVVLLDEPTAALGVAQTEQVLRVIRNLRDNGHAVIYVSHNLRDVFEICDNIAVLRQGSNAGFWRTSETTTDEIVAAITYGHGQEQGGIDG